ncbi:MAG: efflux RND transporter periplasmic adaptor subunit [Pseudomonadota bacterium]
MLKHQKLWIAFFVLLLVAGLGATALKKRSAQAAPATAAPAPATLEFLASDVIQVQPRDLRQTLALSGTLRAVSQAAVKARVAGEVREVLVREGEAVKAGQVLIRMDGSEYQARLSQSSGALLAARGQLDIATKSRDNNQALLSKGFISKNAFDNAASQLDIAQANVASAKGALDVSQKSLNDTIIRAPISGLVSNRTVQPGEKVSPDFHMLDIVDLQRMEMEVAVPTSDIINVALGQEVVVKVEGLPAAVTGKVARISPSTQAGSRSILVYMQLDNPQGLMRVGMFGQAQLTLSKKTGALTVPRSALQNDASNAYVYVIEKNVLVAQPVTLGISGTDGDGGAVEIVKGLESGAQIIKTNLGNLRAGARVSFAPVSSQANTGPPK